MHDLFSPREGNLCAVRKAHITNAVCDDFVFFTYDQVLQQFGFELSPKTENAQAFGQIFAAHEITESNFSNVDHLFQTPVYAKVVPSALRLLGST